MRSSPFPAIAVAAGLALLAPSRSIAAGTDIAFQQFTLPNGMTVIVHEDHKAPIVAVDLWYHVGSKNEVRGRTGFAHLFEHLMFTGSEHHRDKYQRPFEQVGATGQNGTTNHDRTNFFENVPTTALDMALWMESDRMGHLLPAIDQAKLDEQRGVVQNEKRQGENQPYGRSFDVLMQASFPEGHPYHWSTIGSMEDLNAASLDDVKAWFRDYYGAANVVLVLAGDIDLPTAKDKAAAYFGHIPAGPPITRPGQWIAARSESSRGSMQDRVAQTMLIRSWNIPGAGSDDATLLDLASQVLGGSAASRLDARLTYKDQSVDSIGTFANAMEIAGVFGVQAMVKAGVDPATVEAAFTEELARFLAQGPTPAELERARTVMTASFARQVERVGGFGGKADLLAACYTYLGDAGCFRHEQAVLAAATPEKVRDAARRWLSKGDYTLTVTPFPEFSNAKDSAIDRSKGVPVTERYPDLSFPALQRGKLANGIPVVLARRAGAPVLEVDVVFDAGYAADRGRKLGTGGFTTAMLREGAGALDSLAFKARAEELGAGVGAGSSLDSTTATLSALPAKLDPSLALFADMLRRPRFAEADIARLKKQWLAGIAQEKTEPEAIANRLLPPLLYGEGHPYAIPFSGTGTEASIAAIERADLVAYSRELLRPDNATVVVAGDIGMAEIVPLLDKYFADWKSEGAAPKKSIATVPPAATARVYLVDKPGAIQTVIAAGQLVTPQSDPQRFELATAANAIGGVFTSRLNMNLREDKHWSYGAGGGIGGALGQRPWMLFAPVQTDKTRESLVEFRRELIDVVGSRPLAADEIAKIKNRDVRSLPGRYETIAAVAGSVAGIVRYGYPDDYVQTLKARIEAQTDDGVRAKLAATLTPDRLTWVIVGDLAKIESAVRELHLGDVTVIDADGKTVR